MDGLFSIEKVHDPDINLDSEGSDTDTPNNSKLPLGVGNVSPALSLIHNELHESSDAECGYSEPPFDASGSQEANPKGKSKSTKCNGGKPSPGYQAKCEQVTSGSKEFRVYTADENTWTCRTQHEGLCWNCYNSPTCPVCGNTKRRIQ